MRVLHVDSAREWRGSQRQVLLAAQGMADRGHSVTLACRAGGRLESRARAAGLRVRTLDFGGDLSPRAILGLARVLWSDAPDVVHAHDPHATSAALLAARLVRGPSVVASRRVPLHLRGLPSLGKYAACDRVIAVSRAVVRVLLEDGLPPDRLLLIYDGVPDRRPARGTLEALEDLGIPARSPVIGNVAALTEHKDHTTLLAAMPRVLRAVPDARLVIVGSGDLRGRLEAEALRRGLGGRCVFTGFRGDIDRLIPAFSLLCLTSSTEALGSSLLDAMCFSRPVVATATGGIPEAVEHGKTGLLVPVGDPAALAAALVDLLLRADRREALGRAGRRRYEQEFTAERMVDETLRLYEDVRATSAVRERPVRSGALDRDGRQPPLAEGRQPAPAETGSS
jgi:glycosyltransferase involved in cell wall biosynthesis